MVEPIWNRTLTRVEELQCAYSDTYKDAYGMRPRFMSPEQWNSEEWLNKQLNDLYAAMQLEDQWELDQARQEQEAAQAEADALNAALAGSEVPLTVSLFDLTMGE